MAFDPVSSLRHAPLMKTLSQHIPTAAVNVGSSVSRFVTQGTVSTVYANRPAYPCDPLRLVQRYVDHEVSGSELTYLAQHILATDGRFAGNASPYLAAMRAIPTPAWASSALRNLPHGKVADLMERLTDDMVALAYRPPIKVDGVTQRFAHLAGGGPFSLCQDYAVGSLAAKHDKSPKHAYLRAYGANSASVTYGGRLLLWRSGRSDTVPKIEEALVGACCATLEASQAAQLPPDAARGMHRTARGLEFRPVIVTAMDRNWVKGVYMRLCDGLSERAQLAAMHKARTALFGSDGGTPCRLESVAPAGGPGALQVAIRMPPVVNVVLSSQSGDPGQVRGARRDNRTAGLVFIRDLVQAWSGAPDEASRAVASALDNCQSEESAKSVLEALPHCHRYATLSARQRMALDWLMLTFVGHDADGEKWLDREDPGKEILFLKHLLDEINALPAAQCKSGMDRTSLITGLFAAAECHEARTGEPFDPREVGPVLESFRDSFTHIVNKLCEPLLTLVRGMGGLIKWQDAYVPREYYRPRMEPGAPLGFTHWDGERLHGDNGNLTWYDA